MKHFITLTFFIILAITTKAQVGFNNPNPHPSALIDMKASDKGLLVPRVTTANRDAMLNAVSKPAHALLVFDTDLNMFFFYDSIPNPDRWLAVNPWTTDAKSGSVMTSNVSGNVGIGTTTAPTAKLEVNGNTKVTGNVTTTGNVTAAKFYGDGIIPAGGIIMWSGYGGTVPAGWALCTGGTISGMPIPDLRDRFIVATGGAYSIGNTGGAASVTLTEAQIPSHAHSVNDPGHAHIWRMGRQTYSGGKQYGLHDVNSTDTDLTPTIPNSTPAGVEYQPGSAVKNNTTGISITPTGGSQPHENRPPYYALAFIIKLP